MHVAGAAHRVAGVGLEHQIRSRFSRAWQHEAWFIELLSKERDGVGIPSGHFRRGEPGEAPYSKNRGFYNP